MEKKIGNLEEDLEELRKNKITLKKSIEQKDKHIAILIKEKHKHSQNQEVGYKEFLNDKVRFILKGDRSESENFMLEKNNKLKTEIKILRDKISELKANVKHKDEEMIKIKDDNYYLVTRLKNMRSLKS